MSSNTSNAYFDELKSAIKNQNSDGFIVFNNLMSKFSKPSSTIDYCLLLEALINSLHKFPFCWVQKVLSVLPVPATWIDCDEKVRNNMLALIASLFSNYPTLHNDIVSVFLQIFYFRDFVGQKTVNYATYRDVSVDFFILLCNSTLQSTSGLVNLIIQKFPNWRRPVLELIWATCIIMHLLSSNRSANLLTASQKCLMISTICTAIIDLELNPEGFEMVNIVSTFENRRPDLVEKLFQTFDKSFFDDNINHVMDVLQSDAISSINANWLKLEFMSFLIISHFKIFCTDFESTTTDKLNWDFLCTVFRSMRDLFSQHILHVDSHLVVFPMICFYACSLRGGLVINFVEFLWTTIKDDRRDAGSRLMALSYLTFFLVSGNFCLTDLVVELMHDMSSWLVDYTYRRRRFLADFNPTTSLTDNKVYYALCDALIFLFVQLHASLLDVAYYQNSCDQLPIGQISLSPFKPLDQTPSDVIGLFSHIISTYHMNWSTFNLIQSAQTTVKKINPSVDQLVCLKASKFFAVRPNQCHLSLASAFIRRLFRTPALGRKLCKPSKRMNQRLNGDLSIENRTCTKRARRLS